MSNKKSSTSKMTEEDGIPETETSKDFINFFLGELRNLFWGGKHLDRLFKKMRKTAVAESLKDSLTGHLENFELHLERLKQIFDLLGEVPREKKSEVMAALVEEAKVIFEGTGKKNEITDSRIILAAQKILYHTMAAYGTLLQLAETMGNEDIIALLNESLTEEKQAAEILNNLAESSSANKSDANVNYKSVKDTDTPAAAYDSINLTGKHTNE